MTVTITTMGGELVELLTIAQYAELVGKSERTVWRWLPHLEGAQQQPDGSWRIPSTARPQLPSRSSSSTSSAVERRTPAPAQQLEARPATIAAQLEQQPAYLDVDTAARLLGIPAGAIRRNRDRFGAEPFGAHGALVVPAGTVRRIAGLA